ILVGGGFVNIGGQTRVRFARLNADGTVDPTFNCFAGSEVTSLAVQADGKILAGGAFVQIGGSSGQPRNYIARIDPVTGFADGFMPNSDGWVRQITVQADGKILVGGDFTNIGGQPRGRIARLDPITGAADSFNPNATGGGVRSIDVEVDRTILVGGSFTNIGGQSRNRIARLDPATGLADTFNPNANNPVYWLAHQPDGRILVVGNFTSIGGQP